MPHASRARTSIATAAIGLFVDRSRVDAQGQNQKNQRLFLGGRFCLSRRLVRAEREKQNREASGSLGIHAGGQTIQLHSVDASAFAGRFARAERRERHVDVFCPNGASSRRSISRILAALAFGGGGRLQRENNASLSGLHHGRERASFGARDARDGA